MGHSDTHRRQELLFATELLEELAPGHFGGVVLVQKDAELVFLAKTSDPMLAHLCYGID